MENRREIDIGCLNLSYSLDEEENSKYLTVMLPHDDDIVLIKTIDIENIMIFFEKMRNLIK